MPLVGSKTKLLAEVPLFSACTRRELARVAALAERVAVPAGDALTREGEPGRDFFVIAEGEADLTIAGRRRGRLGPGDFFGELALLDQGPRTATVVARTPMAVYRIGARDFARLLDEVPFVGKRILRGMATRLRQLERAPAYVWNRL